MTDSTNPAPTPWSFHPVYGLRDAYNEPVDTDNPANLPLVNSLARILIPVNDMSFQDGVRGKYADNYHDWPPVLPTKKD